MRGISAQRWRVVGLGIAVVAFALVAAAAGAASADLSVHVTAPASTPAGSTVTFVVTVTNNGPDAAQAVVLSGTVPAGTTYFNSGDTGSTHFAGGTTPAFGSATGTIAGNITSLPVGAPASATATLTFEVNPATPVSTVITLIASVSSSTSDPSSGNNTGSASTTASAAVGGSADVAASVTAPTTAQAGSDIAYTVTVTNHGPNAAQAVAVSGTVPAGTTWDGASYISGQEPDGGTTPSGGGTGAVVVAYTSLVSGATSSFSVRVRVADGTLSGTVVSYTMTASSSTSDPTPGNNASSVTTTITGAYPYDTWVPVASHNPGKANSQWRSDLGLLNTGAVTANVQIKFYGGTGVVTNTTYVPAKAQSILTDVVGQVGGTNSGALEILSDQPLRITARSYNLVSASASCYPNATQGQDYPAVLSSGGLSATQSAYLPGLSETPTYRCNIGVVNTGTGIATVLVELFDGAGTKLTDYTVMLNPGDWKQETQPFFYKAAQTAMDRGYAKITVQSGSGVFAFGSVVDGFTNDPTTVSMQP
ncbi:MAG: DUF11 domain-containing protein [Acidobacteriia bacterium]|nr:DUF11 domain-containing protein [Terriglobia bacterium]